MVTNQSIEVSFKHYGTIIIPKGTKTSNMSAMGFDDKVNFVNEFAWIKKDYPEISNILLHDAIHYGINVPIEYLTK